MSLPIDDVLAILRDHLPPEDSTTLNAIAKDLIKAERDVKEANKATGPKASTRLAILIRGDASLQRAVAAGAFVIAVPDPEDDPQTSATYMGDCLLQRIRKAATLHNEGSTKGSRRRRPKRTIKTLHDGMTLLKAKTFKDSGSTITIRQKGTPCEVVVVQSENLLEPTPSS